MNSKPKFIRIISYGNLVYINIQYIESVAFIDGKTRIYTICPEEGCFTTNEPLEEIMRKIREES